MRALFHCLLLTLLSQMVVSCLSENSKDLAEINKNEAVVKEKHDSIKLALKLDYSYTLFIRKYPSDTNIPRMLFEDAQLNIYPLKKTETALHLLDDLYTKYPDSRFSANAMFKAAFLNETVLGRTNKARELYTDFINKYPNNSLANDARLSLENIGLSPEEQLKKIQAKQDSLKNATSAHN